MSDKLEGDSKKERVIAYIDGFNLYHGMVASGFRDCRWLDVRELCKSILKDNQNLIEIKYFTAKVRGDEDGGRKQKRYLDVLGYYCKVNIIEGFFTKHKRPVKIEEVQLKGHRLKSIPESLIFYTKKREEKGSDVNLAAELLCDAFEDKLDKALIFSGDGDFRRAIEKVKEKTSKKVVVIFPPKRDSRKLKEVADGTKKLTYNNLECSRLPEKVEIKPGSYRSAPKGWLPID